MNRKTLLAAFCAAGVVMIAVLYGAHTEKRSNVNPPRVSVILHGPHAAAWTSVKKGAEQAAADLGAEMRFVVLDAAGGVAEQIDQIAWEAENGAQAILIAPAADTPALRGVLLSLQKRNIPVVTFESTLRAEPPLTYISGDNRRMGEALGEDILRMGNTRSRICIVGGTADAPSAALRMEGLENALLRTQNTLRHETLPLEPKAAAEAAKRLMRGGADVFVALEISSLEACAAAKQQLLEEHAAVPELYGIGRSNAVVALLETGCIRKIAVQNEFNIGYLGVECAVNALNGKPPVYRVIETAIVGREDMYTERNQRLLVPFGE